MGGEMSGEDAEKEEFEVLKPQPAREEMVCMMMRDMNGAVAFEKVEELVFTADDVIAKKCGAAEAVDVDMDKALQTQAGIETFLKRQLAVYEPTAHLKQVVAGTMHFFKVH